MATSNFAISGGLTVKYQVKDAENAGSITIKNEHKNDNKAS